MLKSTFKKIKNSEHVMKSVKC